MREAKILGSKRKTPSGRILLPPLRESNARLLLAAWILFPSSQKTGFGPRIAGVLERLQAHFSGSIELGWHSGSGVRNHPRERSS